MWRCLVILSQIVAGKIMEQGPMLVLSFNAQQMMVVRDKSGKVVEGDPVCVNTLLFVCEVITKQANEVTQSLFWK